MKNVFNVNSGIEAGISLGNLFLGTDIKEILKLNKDLFKYDAENVSVYKIYESENVNLTVDDELVIQIRGCKSFNGLLNNCFGLNSIVKIKRDQNQFIESWSSTLGAVDLDMEDNLFIENIDGFTFEMDDVGSVTDVMVWA